VRVQFHQVAQLQAEVRQRQNDLAKASQDLQRRQRLAASGAVSGEEIQHAADVLANARDGLEASRQQLAQRRAMTDRLTLASHPDVQAAASRVKDAYVALHRTEIPAPVSGVVSRRNVQVGQRIAAGTPLMSIVPLEQLWVDANFKESQLEDIRVGQSVTLTADVYGNRVVLHGLVAGLDAGTGSAFALLPAQNATGNWIKVTQRLPVRIELEPAELQRYPLRLGMSMRVTIDTRQREDTKLDAPDAGRASYDTPVFDEEMRDAEQLVRSIITANADQAAASYSAAAGTR
jgi:membrane fusion protein (multidrug efflux system)